MTINEVVYKVLSANEVSSLAGSPTAKQLMDGLKPLYQDGKKDEVLAKIEYLIKELKIPFPTNYREILEHN